MTEEQRRAERRAEILKAVHHSDNWADRARQENALADIIIDLESKIERISDVIYEHFGVSL